MEVETDDAGIGIETVVTAIGAEDDSCQHHQCWEMSRLVLNRSFLRDLGVGVRSSIKTGVLHSRDRASQRLRRPTECLGMRPGSAVEDQDLIREDKGESQTERRWVSI